MVYPTLWSGGTAECVYRPPLSLVRRCVGRGRRRATSTQPRVANQVGETISGLVAGHSGYAQPPVSVLPALRAPPSRVPYNAVLCAQPSARPRRVSEACHTAAPHAAGTKAAARSRRHRRWRPVALRAHLAARPVHVTGRSCGGAAQRPREAARVVVDPARRLAAL